MKPHSFPCNRVCSALLRFLILAAISPSAQAGQYGETFDAYPVNASSFSAATGELFSNQLGTTAKIMDATMLELQLTADAVGGTFSAFRLPDLDSGSAVTAFSAKWNAQIYGSTTVGLADGLSFNFGPLTGPGSFFTNVANPNEAGFGVGLSVGLTTYDGNTPGYYVRVNGKVVPGGFVAKSGGAWGSLNTTRHFFEVDWHALTGLSLRVDGSAIFTNLRTPGFVPDVGNRFVFGARTGGLDQEVRLDNIVVVTGGILTPVAAVSPYFFNVENLPNEGAAKAFDNDPNTKWLATTPSGTIGASLASAATVRAYTMTSANDFQARDPKSWTFETGDNGTTWTNRGAKSAQFFQNRFEKRAFVVANPAANSKFRLNISANNGSSGTQLADLQAWELTPGPAFFKVFTTADSGADSLRNALTVAGANSGQAIITFSSSLGGGTITPASELVINDSSGVGIDASNLTGGIILNGSNARRIMSNAGTGPVFIRGITFTGGNGVAGAIAGAGGAFLGSGGSSTEFSQCTIVGNTGELGGGLANLGQMSLLDCTVSANTAEHGGGIENEGSLSVSRCTIQGNTASAYGGGIENQNSLQVSQSTISGNQSGVAAGGGGIDGFGGSISLTNCIVAKNTTAGTGADLNLENCTFTRIGANIIQGVAVISGVTESGPAVLNADPLLAPLGNYGGPTKTMALKPGSPARNASVGSTATADQRGFPVIGNPDIGAYEAGTLTNFDNWVWESLPGTATDAQHAAGADFDGDGQTNEGEWLAQTDPGNPLSVFRITAVVLNGTTLEVSFPTVVGRVYSVEYSTNGINWTSLGDSAGTGVVFKVNVGPLTGIPRFFARTRVR